MMSVSTTGVGGPRRGAVTRSVRGAGALTRAMPAIVGVIVVLGLWVVASSWLDLGEILPQPWVVLQNAWEYRSLLWVNTGPTLTVAAQGFLLGNLVVIPVALAAIVFPTSEAWLIRVAVAIHVIPLIALAPIIIVSISGKLANVVIAAFVVYYPSLIAILLGFHAANPNMIELVSSVGGKRWQEIVKVRTHAALPNIFGGLLIAVPASLLGALVAEFFGGTVGLGGLLVESQRTLEAGRAWAVAVYLGLLAAILYGIVVALRRVVIPWASGEQATSTSLDDATPASTRLEVFLSLVVATVVVTGVWQIAVSAFGVSPAIAKRPVDVANYLIHDAAADGFWSDIGVALGQTLLDALVGFACGMIAAIVLAIVMSSFPVIERGLMPLVIIVRTMPLLALTPLIVLVFGRGLVTVAIVGALISFFPTLVNLMVAFQNTPRTASEVVLASGGTPLTAALKVRFFYGVPALTASTRIAIPQAIIGATLAEWLATGKGVGNFIVVNYAVSDYVRVWAAGVLLVVVVMAIYLIVDEIDSATKRRMR